MFSRVSPFAGLFVGLVLVAGCAKTNIVTQTTPTKISDVPTIQKSAAFVEATNAFRNGAVPVALAQIQSLQARKDLTTADKTFLERQVSLCQQAINHPTNGVSEQAIRASPITITDSVDCGGQALFVLC